MFTFPPESGLKFTFDESWQLVLHWDTEEAYTKHLGRVQGTRTVDYVGVHGGDLYFIELKSFRRHRIENKRRLASGELVEEIASKVRDTIASAVWVCGRGVCDEQLHALLKPLFAPSVKSRVVLWLEEDLQPRPVDRRVLGDEIRKTLRWLNPRVMVRDRNDPLPGLRIESVPENQGSP